MENPNKARVYFTSDVHFGHKNVLRYHPKRRVEANIMYDTLTDNSNEALRQHDEWLIDLWNSTVRKQDYVFHLGDFSWYNAGQTEKLLNKLHGRKFFIRGNHDQAIRNLDNYFEWVGDIKEAKFTNNQFKFIDPNETFCVEMCHYPLLTWNRRSHGSVCAHGHTHGALDDFNTNSGELRVDVGIDSMLGNYHFIELEELYNYFCDIRDSKGCKTFAEYQEMLISDIKG